jgi:predicted ABC-type transport system involved in lysophospholipase L1 biosynthesis ATPase subunit
MPIGEGAEYRLRHAPHELSHGERQTHGRIADVGAFDDRRDVQAQRLSHAHRDHE